MSLLLSRVGAPPVVVMLPILVMPPMVPPQTVKR